MLVASAAPFAAEPSRHRGETQGSATPRRLDRRQRHDQRKGRVGEREGAVGGVPFGRAAGLRVDDQDGAAHFGDRPQAAPAGQAQKPAAEPLALQMLGHGEARQPEPRRVVPG